MNYLPELSTVAVVHMLAVMSPGPDFIMVTRNSLMYSRRTGIYSAVGLGLGILVHVTYSLIGIAFIISQSIVLFSIIKYLGAAYLIYIGYKSIRAKTLHHGEENIVKTEDISKLKAIGIGFLTNVLNPKASLFFLSLFTQVINPSTPTTIKLFYGIEMSVATFLWFALIAILFSNSYFKHKIESIQVYIVKSMGAILILLGIKVALSESR